MSKQDNIDNAIRAIDIKIGKLEFRKAQLAEQKRALSESNKTPSEGLTSTRKIPVTGKKSNAFGNISIGNQGEGASCGSNKVIPEGSSTLVSLRDLEVNKGWWADGKLDKYNARMDLKEWESVGCSITFSSEGASADFISAFNTFTRDLEPVMKGRWILV